MLHGVNLGLQHRVTPTANKNEKEKENTAWKPRDGCVNSFHTVFLLSFSILLAVVHPHLRRAQNPALRVAKASSVRPARMRVRIGKG